MTNAPVKRAPEFGAVWREQLRIVGLSIRREGVIAAALLGLTCLFGVVMVRVPALSALIEGEVDNILLDPGEPVFGFWGVLAALVFPLLVWKGERPWGDTPIWSLPVDHRRHALTKVAAGWVWLMVVLGGALLLVVLAVVAAGGTLGADEVRQLITDEAGFYAGSAGATSAVAWTTPWWQWVLPFTAATAVYLLASALYLATAHPFRWAVAIYFLSGVVFGATEFFEIDVVQRGGEFLAWFIGAGEFARHARPRTSEPFEGFLLLPSIRMWAASAAFWLSLGVACVLAASGRARDH